jgi:hypothetical protein
MGDHVMAIRKNEIKFESEYDSKFQIVQIDGAFGGLNPINGRMTLYFDAPEIEMGPSVEGQQPEMVTTKVKRIFVLEARMSPETFKSLATWMTNNVTEYEKMIKSGNKSPDTQTYYQ